jgi:hypothetical protein
MLNNAVIALSIFIFHACKKSNEKQLGGPTVCCIAGLLKVDYLASLVILAVNKRKQEQFVQLFVV